MDKDYKMTPTQFDYNEDAFLELAKQHIAATYNQHYVSKDSSHEKNVQVIDLLITTGHAESFFLANAIKYLARYGKKEGKNKKDLLKTIHYVCLLMYLNHSEVQNEESD